MKITDPCIVKLSDMYLNYLNLCVPTNPDPLYASIEDLQFKGKENCEFKVIQVGDGCSNDILLIELPSGYQTWCQKRNVKVVKGSLRSVPKRGRIVMGRTSLMGIVCHGIRSGRAFRGRG